MLNGFLQTSVLRAATGEGDAVCGAGLLGHDEAALGNRHLDAGGDLVHRLALTDEGDDFGLSENGALSGDGDDVLRRQGQVRELGQAHLEGAGHGLEETTGTGGALVVHREGLDGAVGVDADALNVLAADVDDRLHKSFETFATGTNVDLEKTDKEQADALVSRFQEIFKDSIGDIKPLAPQQIRKNDEAVLSNLKRLKV